MTIEEKIIEPLQRYIDGADGLFRFPMTQAAREVVRYGDASGLHRQMEPFYEMWIEDSPRLDWTSRSIIGDIAQIDPLFGAWASRQDLMKMARAWAVRGDVEGMLTLLYCVIHSKNYEPYCGESTYEEVTEELRYQRVNGNSSSGEIYALLHAFVTIVMSPQRFDRHQDLFQLMKMHWDFLRHVYCVMTGSIIGPSHELDELCQMLFPEEVKEMLTKHPKPPYRQLATEVEELKVENSELKAERSVLKDKLSTLARRQEEITRQMATELQKAFVEDSIPYAEIEEELLQLPPSSVGSVFSALNDMLGGNDVWHKHYKALRAKVRKREKEKETPAVDARQIIQIGDSPQYDENKE